MAYPQHEAAGVLKGEQDRRDASGQNRPRILLVYEDASWIPPVERLIY